MAAIQFKSRQDIDFKRPSTVTPDIEQGYFFQGSATEPQLFEVFLPPNLEVEPHAHSRDEIIVVTDGELILGSRTLSAGAAVSVPADTLYGFRVGPTGVRFLNFRSRGGADYQTKSDFMERRRESREATS